MSVQSINALNVDTGTARERLLHEAKVTCIAPNGFGFGEGTISVEKQLEEPEQSGLTVEALQVAEEIVVSGQAFSEIEADDDGCGDGRPTGIIYQVINNAREIFHRSLLRAKIFGGGLVVATSMFRAVNDDITSENSVLVDRTHIAKVLNEKDMKFGGHTDEHAHGKNCGCGAIDKYPEITANILKYREQITNVLQQVYDEDFADHSATIDAVFAAYENQLRQKNYFRDAAGDKTRQILERSGAVIKKLTRNHQEDFVILNDIEGTTFDQRRFDKIMKERNVTGNVQVFAVDIWRGKQYAHAIAEWLSETYGMDFQDTYRCAEADFFIRTLATSATLTAGDQPVFMRQ